MNENCSGQIKINGIQEYFFVLFKIWKYNHYQTFGLNNPMLHYPKELLLRRIHLVQLHNSSKISLDPVISDFDLLNDLWGIPRLVTTSVLEQD
jgi:hypothetical protein